MRKVPKLRFKEFSDEWEENKLGEIIEISNLKYNPTKENKKYPCIELESLTQETGKILNLFNSLEQKSIKNKFNKEEILFGKLRPYLKKYYFTEFEGVCSSEIWVFTSKINIKKFIYYFIQTEKFLTLANTTSGTKMPRADWSLMKDENFLIPFIQEQEKIANFLTSVDKKISLTEEKLELFREYKKGVMQKIFSQELRFKDSEGNDYPEWEEKKLGDILENIVDNRGKTPPNNDNNKLIPLIEINAIGERNIKYRNVTKFVEEETYINWFRNHIQKNDILFSTVGATALCSIYKADIKSVIAQNLVGLRTKKEIISDYLYYVLIEKKNNLKFKAIEMIAVQPSIKVSQMVDLKFKISISLEEQQKIADFLSSIDSKIESIEKELEGLKEFKKGLLQQMFV